MTAPMLRGYTVKQTAAFVESDYFEAQVRRRIMEQLPPDVKAALPGIKPAEWYPREYAMAMLRGIAAVKNDDDGSYNDLCAYGSWVATEATNTFLKLFMKILTPTLFAKKVPEIWQRDHRGSGHFEVDVSQVDQGRIGMRLVGADGFDHIGVAAIGFITFGLTAVGKQGVQVVQHGWSMATPAPHVVRYEATWNAERKRSRTSPSRRSSRAWPTRCSCSRTSASATTRRG